MARAAKDLQKALEEDQTLKKDTSRGIGMNLGGIAVGSFEPIIKEIDNTQTTADERAIFSEKAREVGEQGNIDEQSKIDLKTGLKAMETAGADPEMQQSAKRMAHDALGNLARSFKNEADGKEFLDTAKKQIESSTTADDAFKNISGTFSSIKQAEEERANESRTGGDKGESQAKTRQDFSEAAKAAAAGLSKHTEGGGVEADHDSKAPDSGGKGASTTDSKQNTR